MIIFAINLGKFNSICCFFDGASPRATGILPVLFSPVFAVRRLGLRSREYSANAPVVSSMPDVAKPRSPQWMRKNRPATSALDPLRRSTTPSTGQKALSARQWHARSHPFTHAAPPFVATLEYGVVQE